MTKQQHIDSLNPVYGKKVIGLFRLWDKSGIKYKIVDSRRSWLAQWHAWAVRKKRGTVPPSESFHVKDRGRAIDVEFETPAMREKAKRITPSKEFRIVDESRFGYTHLHIDDKGHDGDYKKSWVKPALYFAGGVAISAAGIGITAGIKKLRKKAPNKLTQSKKLKAVKAIGSKILKEAVGWK